MRLRPDARDRLLTILDLLTSGAATLSTTAILQGQVTHVSDALFAAVGPTDPLPALPCPPPAPVRVNACAVPLSLG